MPPEIPLYDSQNTPAPEKKRSSWGAIAGIVVIVLLMIVGILYIWGAWLNNQDDTDPLPFIPGDPTTTQ